MYPLMKSNSFPSQFDQLHSFYTCSAIHSTPTLHPCNRKVDVSTENLHSNTGSTKAIFLTEQSGLQMVITFQKAGHIIKNNQNYMKFCLI